MADNNVDIIIPVYNNAAITKNCLDSIVANSGTPYRLILIDNASDGQARKYLEDFSASHKNVVLVRNDSNVGWVKAVNQGIRMSSAAYVCIMNNDTVVKTPGWLSGLIAVADTAKDIGLVNPRFKVKNNIADAEPYIEVDFCRGYCVLMKKTVIDRIGVLDEAYGLGYYDDDDLSVRAIRAGFRCVRANDVLVEHLGDSTFSDVYEDGARRALHEKNKQLFYSKWGKRLKLVFIATNSSNRDELKNTLLFLVRRQHIVYLWNLAKPLGVRHINVRETIFPNIFPGTAMKFALSLNAAKREDKRYNLVFVDEPRLAERLSKIHPGVHYVRIGEDMDKISKIVSQASEITI